jgi:hypothetical protein
LWGSAQQELCHQFLAFKSKYGHRGIVQLIDKEPASGWFGSSKVLWETQGYPIGFIEPTASFEFPISQSPVADILRHRTRVYLCVDGNVRVWVQLDLDNPRIEDLPLAPDGTIRAPSIGIYRTFTVEHENFESQIPNPLCEKAEFIPQSLEERLVALAVYDEH